MFKILKFLKPYKWGVILVFVLVALRAGLDLLLPMILGLLVSDGIGLSATSVDPNVRRIWELALLMLGATLLSIGVTIISGLMESKISAGFALDLRKAVYQKIEQFSLKE